MLQRSVEGLPVRILSDRRPITDKPDKPKGCALYFACVLLACWLPFSQRPWNLAEIRRTLFLVPGLFGRPEYGMSMISSEPGVHHL